MKIILLPIKNFVRVDAEAIESYSFCHPTNITSVDDVNDYLTNMKAVNVLSEDYEIFELHEFTQACNDNVIDLNRYWIASLNF